MLQENEGSSYDRKRDFSETPEPALGDSSDVDPTTANPGKLFVIHQHHARRLHFDLRLEMFRGDKAVLASWAVPKNLPFKKGERSLAIHVEDHPLEYATFSGTIPEGNYGAGEVRIFDSGNFEMLEQKTDRITFRLKGGRVRGVYHLVLTDRANGKEQWLAILSEDERPETQEPPEAIPMLTTVGAKPFDDPEWGFEPLWDGIRAIAVCEGKTDLLSRNSKNVTAIYPELQSLHERLVALQAMVDGEIIALDDGIPSFEKLEGRTNLRSEKDIERLRRKIPVTFISFDLLFLDGKDLTAKPLKERRELLEGMVVPSEHFQISPLIPNEGTSLFQAAEKQGLKGIVGKRLSSQYHPGKRSSEWIKFLISDLVGPGD